MGNYYAVDEAVIFPACNVKKRLPNRKEIACKKQGS